MLLGPAVLLFVAFVGPGLGADTDPEEGNPGLFVGLVAFLVLILPVGVIWALYVLLLMSRRASATARLGKAGVGIRAVRDNGEPSRFGSAALREVVLKMITAVVIPSLSMPIISGLVNFLWPLWDDGRGAARHRRLAPRLAGLTAPGLDELSMDLMNG